jgi:glycosyltransferase involved in cell wall biosynthesis
VKKISVLIPTYNHAEFLDAAISSVFESLHKNIELIVVDDGSTDNTKEVASKYQDLLFISQENSGAHNALNKAISLSSGDFLAILNDDDLYLPNHLSLAIENLERYGNQIYIGSPEIIGRGPKLDAMTRHLDYSKKQIETLGLGKSIFKINWSISTSAFVFEKKLANHLVGFHNFAMCHDLDFLLRAMLGFRSHVGYSPIPTWQYRCHETNSGSFINIRKAQAEITYAIGRSLDSMFENDGIEYLSKIIGYGIDPKIISEAELQKPWRLEKTLSISESISTWVKKFS